MVLGTSVGSPRASHTTGPYVFLPRVVCLEQERYSNVLGTPNLGLCLVLGFRLKRVISLPERKQDGMAT